MFFQFKLLFIFCFIICINGCSVKSSIPDGYTGELSYINDSLNDNSSSNSTDFFVLSKINGRSVSESISHTSGMNYNQSFFARNYLIGRPVPSKMSVFTILAKRYSASGITQMINKKYRISGEVKFNPDADAIYIVKGILNEHYLAVWLENLRTGQIIGNKIEKQGNFNIIEENDDAQF